MPNETQNDPEFYRSPRELPRHQNESQRRNGWPAWKILLVSSVGVIAILSAILIGGLVYVGTVAPETKVYPGNQVPPRFAQTFDELGLLEPGEKIRFFYSDGLLDIKEGSYLLTDRHLILYSESWSDPKVIIDFDQITSVDAAWSDTWIEDSSITVDLKNGDLWMFPLSMENGTDRRFVEALRESADLPPADAATP